MTCIQCKREFDGVGLKCPDCLDWTKKPKPLVEVIAPKASKMTGPEKAMAMILEAQKRAGEIREWSFEGVKFRWGEERAWYTPDFFVNIDALHFEVVEVKGPHIYEDSRKSFKAAAWEHSWCRWRMLQLVKGVWRTVYDLNVRAAA